MKNSTLSIVDWALRIAVAFILLQTLFFKFTGAEESVAIFEQLGAEPWGRYLSGIGELITSVLLLIAMTVWAGAIMGLGLISGAILSHLFVLGIEFMNDGGTLFYMGVFVFVACATVLFIHRKELPIIGKKLEG